MSCLHKRKADLILHHGVIYTVNSDFAIAEAVAVRDGKILSVGSSADILEEFESPNTVDLKGRPVYPGFIDSHCHFYGYSTDLLKCSLSGTKSYDEILARMKSFAETNTFSWILGRGWDQNDWENKSFPDNRMLDSLFPDKPVFLMRIDGHAALCNSVALNMAKITAATKVDGGEVITANGKPSGLLIDNAVDLVKNLIPPFTPDLVEKALLTGQANCFQAGLTTVDDAGLEKDSIETIFNLQKAGKLKMRVYAMISDSKKSTDYFFKKGKLKTDRLNVCAVKIYADGALGSRGALLKKPYSDMPGHYGFWVKSLEHCKAIADQAIESEYQVCIHAIGDSANKAILTLFDEELRGENNRRWRIEHAQLVSKEDLNYFEKNSILPSVQPTHATSDMYWVEERIGRERMNEAYAYKDLKNKSGDKILFGTDFPVEDINPIMTFFAAVVRRDTSGYPKRGFLMENAVKRKDAIRAMTIWGAYGNFEESEKGSIEPEKFADFVILDRDIMEIPDMEIPKAKVVATYLNGEKVF